MPPRPDARKLAAPALQLLRAQVVRAVEGGMPQTAAAATCGASLRAVQKWRALARTGGPDALTLKRRGRRPGGGALAAAQATRLRRLVVDMMPDQLARPFSLWTRAAVAPLIAQRTGGRLARTTVGQYRRAGGADATEARPTRVRAERGGDHALARHRGSDHRGTGQAGQGDDLLGGRDGRAE